MGSHDRIGWLGRTFGWSGSRREWAGLLGVVAWLVGAVLLARAARGVTAGQGVLLAAVWLLLLGVFARDFVRHLFGPVFFYEVVRIGRRRATFLGRGFFAVSLSLGLGLYYLDWLADHRHLWSGETSVGTQELSQFGERMFNTFAVVQFLTVVFITPVYVAGAVTVEKERKTLEFLFATDLRNGEIVFGKVAARVGVLLLYVLAGLPVVAMLQLFGGVDPEQLLAVVAATAMTVVGLSALSIWFSCRLRKSRDAIAVTYMAALVYYVGGFLLAIYANFYPLTGWWNTRVDVGLFQIGFHDFCWWVGAGNPVFSFFVLEESRRFGATTYTLGDMLGQFALAWAGTSVLLLGHAVLTLRAVTLRQAYGAPPARAGGTWGAVVRRWRAMVGLAVATVAFFALAAAAPVPDAAVTAAVLGLVVWGVLWVPRLFRRQPRPAEPAAGPRRPAGRAPRDYPPVGENPVLWKEVFVDSGRAGLAFRIFAGLIAAIILFFLGLIVWFEWIDPNPWVAGRPFPARWKRFTEEVNVWVRVVTGVVGTLMFFGVAVRAAGAVSGERDRDTWVSLLSCPLSADQILWGKWWGAVLSARRPLAFLAGVWCLGLCVGAVHPLAVPLMLAATAVYLPVFAAVGLYCSMTSRNTLTASVKAFFAALFCAGGFWLLVALCVALPLSLMRVNANDGTEEVFKMFLGATPAFVYGWLPVRGFVGREMEPFYNDYSHTGPGLAAPLVGLVVWTVFDVVAMAVCLIKFRRVTNRVADRLPGEPEPARVG